MSGETNPNRIRDDEIYAKRMRGASLESLAQEYGVSDAWISQIVRNVSRSMPERDRSELLARSVEFLDQIQEKVMEQYNLTPPPVFIGKDGVIAYDEKGNVVRDYSLQRASIDQMMKLSEIVAKRLGLNAPTQTEVKASVQYEIVGVDPEELT